MILTPEQLEDVDKAADRIMDSLKEEIIDEAGNIELSESQSDESEMEVYAQLADTLMKELSFRLIQKREAMRKVRINHYQK